MISFFNKPLLPERSGPEAAKLLLQLLHVQVSQDTLFKEMEEHPDHTSLACISDVLSRFGVENITARFEPEKFIQVPGPFITQIRSSTGKDQFFTVVKTITADSIHFFEPEKKCWVTQQLQDFFDRCQGILLMAEATSGAGEKDYQRKVREKNEERIKRYLLIFSVPAVTLFTVAATVSEGGAGAILPCLFLLLLLAGAVVSTLLLWYEWDQDHPVLQQICHAGSGANCHAVLQSSASKIAGISWSTISFSYFGGGLLLLLMSGLHPAGLSIVAWMNVMALPYTVFSIYYQWRIARQWCVLCLAVQAILLLQFATACTTGWYSTPFGDIDLVQVILCFLLPFVVASLLVPAYRSAAIGKRHYIALQRLKHNPQFFDGVLSKQKMITSGTEGLGINLGNPAAPYQIVKVCNPYCAPCAQSHVVIDELLSNNPDVQVKIIFAASSQPEDIKAPPVKHLLAIAGKEDESLLKQALDLSLIHI